MDTMDYFLAEVYLSWWNFHGSMENPQNAWKLVPPKMSCHTVIHLANGGPQVNLIITFPCTSYNQFLLPWALLSFLSLLTEVLLNVPFEWPIAELLFQPFLLASTLKVANCEFWNNLDICGCMFGCKKPTFNNKTTYIGLQFSQVRICVASTTIYEKT